jgi:bifunctional non-homologous end joining protein LigD
VLPRIRPMRLRSVSQPPDDPDYLWELKHDGFRALVYVQSGECRLVSRNLNNLRFDSLRTELSKLPVRDAILDGEIVHLDAHGVSQFNPLLTSRGRNTAVFYAFDLLWLDHTDMRKLPLVVRKAKLCDLVRGSNCPRLLYAQHVESAGKQFFGEICRRDLEGIVGKHRGGSYREDKPDWVKVKNRSYSQAEGRHELLSRKRR